MKNEHITIHVEMDSSEALRALKRIQRETERIRYHQLPVVVHAAVGMTFGLFIANVIEAVFG